MMIKTIIELLKNKSFSVTNSGKFREWLELFSESSSYKNKKLLVCIAIDIFSGNLSLESLNNVILILDITKEPYIGFYEGINSHLNILITPPNFKVCGCPDGENYIVVMKNSHLKLLCNNNNQTYQAVNPAFKNTVLDKWLDIECLHKFPKNNPAQRKDLFWITPKEQIKKIVKQFPDNHATEIVNRLAIYWIEHGKINNDNEMVYLEISDKFNETCWQPTSIDGDSELYISYKKKDNFGRSRSVDGKFPICSQERVFLGFDSPAIGFQVKEYARGTAMLKDIEGQILVDSYERLISVIS